MGLALSQPEVTDRVGASAGTVTENEIAVALGLVGDEWNLAIVRVAMHGVRRYNDFLERLGVANSVLSARLRRLTEAGVLSRVQYQDTPARFEYRLTECGRALWRVQIVIWAWELDWVKRHSEPIPKMMHAVCGKKFSPQLHCKACHKPADDTNVSARFGPSGGFLRSVPQASTRRRSTNTGGYGPGLVPETIALIGNRWSASLLAALFFGAHRFTDVVNMLGAPPTIVSERLSTFCDLGVLSQKPTSVDSSRMEYHLTKKGRALFPLIMVATGWAGQWFRSKEGPAIIYTHASCGKTFVPVLHCSACSRELHGLEIVESGANAYSF
jgi:DNA-binding HxlR family transcriptional regulator